ncbi:MAG: hypothetical protein AAGN82_18405 [Myxococcota bacterium]
MFLKRAHVLRRCGRQKVTCLLRAQGRSFAIVDGVPAAVTDGTRVFARPDVVFPQLVHAFLRSGLEIVLDASLPSWFPSAAAPDAPTVDAVIVEAARRWPLAATLVFVRDHGDRTGTLGGDADEIMTRCEVVDGHERVVLRQFAQGGTLADVLAASQAPAEAVAGLVLGLSAAGRLRWSSGAPVPLSGPAAATAISTPAAPLGRRGSTPALSTSPPGVAPGDRTSSVPYRPQVHRTRRAVPRRSTFRSLESASPPATPVPRPSRPGGPPDAPSAVPSHGTPVPRPSRPGAPPLEGRRSRPMQARRRSPTFDPRATSEPFIDDREPAEVGSPAEPLLAEVRDAFAGGDGTRATERLRAAAEADPSHVSLPLYRLFLRAFKTNATLRATLAAEAEALEKTACEVLAQDHGAPFPHFVRACLAMVAGRHDDARRGFSLVARLRPADRWTRRMMRSLPKK